jgi:pimeloyl-ACP methyl ester carboxylesterase
MTTAVLVHGGWHSASCWDLVRAELDREQVASVAPQLPMSSTLDADAAVVAQTLAELGDDAVVVAHSWGGSPVTLGASGAPNLRHLIYLAAFLLEAGRPSAADMRTLPPSPVFSIGPQWSHISPEHAYDVFYQDVDPRVAAEVTAQLRPFACAGWDPVATTAAPAWQQVPATYVVCTADRAIPPDSQRAMAALAAETVEIDAGHSAFLSRPAEVAAIIAERVRRYPAARAAAGQAGGRT